MFIINPKINRMKKLYVFISSLFSIILFFSSCGDCDCPAPSETLISTYDLNKMIVETNTTNVATGFESVFYENILDSISRAELCQAFVDSALFYNDNSGYFFIETLDNAWVVAHINHDIIGTSRFDVQDENGKYFIRDIVQTVKYSGYGFVDYYRKNPSSGDTERKLSFVTSIPAANWFIGTGFYGGPQSGYYSQYEVNQNILLESVTSMSKGIANVIKVLYTNEDDKVNFCRNFLDHIKFFDDGSGYFFVNDMEGINIAHGADANHQGKNDYDLQDSRGTYIIRNMIDIVNNNGSGFYEYYWVNPASGLEEMKVTYVSAIRGTNYFIGAGFYFN